MGLVLAIAAVCVVVGAARAQPAQAQPACAEEILEDWTSGVLDSTYPGDCYEAAIDALPEDLRAYTSAADDISRAMAAALRSGGAERELASSPASTRSDDVRALPAVVVGLAALVAVLGASGVGAYAIRQRRDR